MKTQHLSKLSIAVTLLFDAVLIIFACFNIAAMREAADLPREYRPRVEPFGFQPVDIGESPVVLSIDTHSIPSKESLPFVLSMYKHGDTVSVAESRNNRVIHRNVVLTAMYSTFDILSHVFIGNVFLLFGIYVIIKHRSESYSVVLHAVVIGTAIMILLDWGYLGVHSDMCNFLLRLLFDTAIWLLPAFFFHFSFIYPSDTSRIRRILLPPWYMLATAGIGLSFYYLISLFFLGTPVNETYYVELHTYVNDIVLIIALLCTVAKFEHSALTISKPEERKRVYWVLLGIIFGPLVYVFLILAPRIILGYELLSDSLMQYSLLMAPLMFWKALRMNPAHESMRVTHGNES